MGTGTKKSAMYYPTLLPFEARKASTQGGLWVPRGRKFPGSILRLTSCVFNILRVS